MICKVKEKKMIHHLKRRMLGEQVMNLRTAIYTYICSYGANHFKSAKEEQNNIK